MFFIPRNPCSVVSPFQSRVWVTCSEPRDCWAPATGTVAALRSQQQGQLFTHHSSFSLFLFQGHGLHLEELFAFPSLSNCCFRVPGGGLVSLGVITEVSLSVLGKPWPARSCVLEWGAWKTEQVTDQPRQAWGASPHRVTGSQRALQRPTASFSRCLSSPTLALVNSPLTPGFQIWSDLIYPTTPR